MKTDILRKELDGDGTGKYSMKELAPNGLTCPLDP